MQTTSNDTETRRLPGTAILLAVLVAAGVLARWLSAVAFTALHRAASGVPVRGDEALVAVVAGAAAVLVLWVAVGVLVEVSARLPGAVGDAARTASAVITPRVVRRIVGLALGVGMATALAPGASTAAPPVARQVVAAAAPLPDPGFAPLPDPAWAATDDAPPPPAGAPPGPVVGDAAWVPTTPTVRPQADVRMLGHRPAGDAPVVVHRGDTLWSIAARALGPGASDSEVARAWPAWYAENRDVVGDDPDVLRPGQVLRAPRSVTS